MALKQKKPTRVSRAPNQALRAAYDQHRKELEARGVSIPDAFALGVEQFKSRTPKQIETTKKVVLLWLMRGYTKSRASMEAKIAISTLANWRRDDQDFNDACKKAIDGGTDYYEDEARRRAVEGVDRPVFQQGECVGFVREYSDALMSMMLGGRRPEVYGKQRVEMSGPEGGAIKHEIEVTFVKPKEDKHV